MCSSTAEDDSEAEGRTTLPNEITEPAWMRALTKELVYFASEIGTAELVCGPMELFVPRKRKSPLECTL